MATTATFGPILKEYYENFVSEAVNNEKKICSFFEKSTRTWAGNQLHIPVHISRNSGVGNIAEGGAYPTAGSQGWVDLIVDSETLAGNGTITRKMIKKARKSAKPKHVFLSYWDGEVMRIKDDLINLACQRMISGGRVKGFLNQKVEAAVANNTGGIATIAVPNAGTNVYDYFGDLGPFDGSDTNPTAVAAGTSATWVRVRLFRMDTYAEIAITLGGGTAAGHALFVSAIDATARTVSLSVIGDAAGSDLQTDGVPAGVGIALALHDTQHVLVGGADAGLNFGTTTSFANQQTGLFGNLADPTHFTVNRGAAANASLRASILTQATGTTSATSGRAAVTSQRLQRLIDDIFNANGKETDSIWINARTRSAYVAVLTATLQTQTRGKAGMGDMGFANVGYADLPFKKSQHVPLGGYIFLCQKTWELAELERPSFVDEDGSLLSRISGVSAFEFQMEWDFNLVCFDPQSNGILCGTTL